MYKERKGGKHEEKVISRDSGTCIVFYKYAPPQTIFAEEFTSGNQDVVSEEETPEIDRKSTRLNSSHSGESRMPSSA